MVAERCNFMEWAVAGWAWLTGSCTAVINVPQPVLGHSFTVIKASDHDTPVLFHSYLQNIVLNVFESESTCMSSTAYKYEREPGSYGLITDMWPLSEWSQLARASCTQQTRSFHHRSGGTKWQLSFKKEVTSVCQLDNWISSILDHVGRELLF